MPLLSDAEFAQLSVAKLVIHEVGPAESDFKLFKGEHEPGEAAAFFRSRLEVANRGSAYEFNEGSGLHDALKTIRDDASQLVEHGRRLATAFNDEHEPQSKAGSFVMFTLALGDESLFAIVKFDHQSAIGINDTSDTAGMQLLPKAIVEARAAMQKSALIRLTDAGGELAVRDRRGKDVPAYFERFLGARRRFTPTQLTQTLETVLKQIAEENREALDPGVLREIPTRIYRTVQRLPKFDPEQDELLTAVFGALPEESPVRTSFAARLERAGIEDEVFEFDKGAVAEPTRKKIVTLEGIEVVYGKQYDDLITRRVHADGRTVITIQTSGIARDEQLP